MPKTCAINDATMQLRCNSDSENHMPDIPTSNEYHLLNFLRRFELQFMDKQLCNEATLVSLLKSPCLEEIFINDVEAMSNEVMFNHLSFQREGYLRSSKVRKIFLISCPNITDEPFVHWFAREDCVLEFLYLQCCNLIECTYLKAAAKKYNKVVTLLDA